MTTAENNQELPDEYWPVIAARAAAAKTDADTVVLDISELLVVTGYFVVTSASNPRLVRAIADEVERVLTVAGGPKPLRIEGLDAPKWVLMDYGDFVVHVFDEDTRALYDLERLWRDAPRIDWRDPDDPQRAEVAGTVVVTVEGSIVEADSPMIPD